AQIAARDQDAIGVACGAGDFASQAVGFIGHDFAHVDAALDAHAANRRYLETRLPQDIDQPGIDLGKIGSCNHRSLDAEDAERLDYGGERSGRLDAGGGTDAAAEFLIVTVASKECDSGAGLKDDIDFRGR